MEIKQPWEWECQYCGGFYTPSSSKQTHCCKRCACRHIKERTKRRRMIERGFEGVFPIESIPNKLFYTIEESAELIGSHEKTIRRLISSGKIKVIKEGKLLRIPFKSINELIKIQEDESNS